VSMTWENTRFWSCSVGCDLLVLLASHSARSPHGPQGEPLPPHYPRSVCWSGSQPPHTLPGRRGSNWLDAAPHGLVRATRQDPPTGRSPAGRSGLRRRRAGRLTAGRATRIHRRTKHIGQAQHSPANPCRRRAHGVKLDRRRAHHPRQLPRAQPVQPGSPRRARTCCVRWSSSPRSVRVPSGAQSSRPRPHARSWAASSRDTIG
jgi:hypothetical protein